MGLINNIEITVSSNEQFSSLGTIIRNYTVNNNLVNLIKEHYEGKENVEEMAKRGQNADNKKKERLRPNRNTRLWKLETKSKDIKERILVKKIVYANKKVEALNSASINDYNEIKKNRKKKRIYNSIRLGKKEEFFEKKKNLHSIYSFYNLKSQKQTRLFDKANFFREAESDFKYSLELKDYDGILSTKLKSGYERYKFTPKENFSLWEKIIAFFKSKKDSAKKYKSTQTILDTRTKKPVKIVKQVDKKNKIFKVDIEENKEYQKKSKFKAILTSLGFVLCLSPVFCLGVFFNDIINYIKKNIWLIL